MNMELFFISTNNYRQVSDKYIEFDPKEKVDSKINISPHKNFLDYKIDIHFHFIIWKINSFSKFQNRDSWK